MSMIQLRIPYQALSQYSRDDKITITGNFDNWEHTKFVLRYDAEEHCFGVNITGISTRTIVFKFLINDKEWVTLPYFETEIDNTGFVNNVLRPQELKSAGAEDHLDEITISSNAEREPQQGNFKKDADNSTETDYIHISSQDELSSTEDVQLEPTDSDIIEDIHVDGPYSRPKLSTSGSTGRLQTLVTVVKRVKMYWSG